MESRTPAGALRAFSNGDPRDVVNALAGLKIVEGVPLRKPALVAWNPPLDPRPPHCRVSVVSGHRLLAIPVEAEPFEPEGFYEGEAYDPWAGEAA